MNSEYHDTIKIRVPFKGYVDAEIVVRKNDEHWREVQDAKQIMLMNCEMKIGANGILLFSHPDDGVNDIRLIDYDIEKRLDVDNAEELKD